jgi:hypothetical protein
MEICGMECSVVTDVGAEAAIYEGEKRSCQWLVGVGSSGQCPEASHRPWVPWDGFGHWERSTDTNYGPGTQ